jgi:hypothetical protein
MHRRGLLLSGAALLVQACGSGGGQAEGRDVDDEAMSSMLEEYNELLGAGDVPGIGGAIDARRFPAGASRGDIFTDPFVNAEWNAPPLTPELTEVLRNARYWSVPETSRPAPVWAAGPQAPDYQHLDEFAPPQAEFELTAATLAFLAERNAFVFRDRQSVRIFALRGCSLADDAEDVPWASAHRVQLATPDHLSCKCLLGVWRQGDGQIALFRSSTVPAVSNMFKSLRTEGAGASLLPTGLYRYRAGSHKRTSPTAIQRGALLIEGEYVVLRTPDDLSYNPFQPNDIWTRGAAHNIHSAGVWSRPDVYDSAGCQVVRGGYTTDRLRAEGSWARFREAAGLVGADGAAVAPEAAGEGSYDYMLLTGQEAALHASGSNEFISEYRRIRPGSSGDAVRAEKQRLRITLPNTPLSDTDRFDMWTAFATLMEQKRLIDEYIAPITVV